MSDDSNRSNSWISVCALGAGTAGMLALSLNCRSAAGLAATFLTAMGFIVATVGHVRMRLLHTEEIEREEFESLKRQRTGSELFSTEEDIFRSRQSRQLFDRWMVPLACLLLCLGNAAWVWWMWRSSRKVADRLLAEPVLAAKATMAMALYGLIALFFFVLGKYASGLSQSSQFRALRSAASHLLLSALGSGIACIVCAAAWAGFPKWDFVVAYVWMAFAALVVLELLVTLVLEIYRPRTGKKQSRLIYESRLVGMLGEASGLFKTAANALDYQFGFKVSETWFFRYLEKAAVWLVLFEAVLFWLSTSVVLIDPQEQGCIERLGRLAKSRGVLEPGFHLKWPWPIEQAFVISTRTAQSFNVGFVPDEEMDKIRTLVWTQAHYKKEYNMLVACRETVENTSSDDREQPVPVNLLAAGIPVQYCITNLLDWSYRHANGPVLLEELASREVIRYLASVDIEQLMSVERRAAAQELKQRIQQSASQQNLGVDILFVGLQDIHPPISVAPAYEQVIGATQERESTILKAQEYKAGQVPLALAEASRIVSVARAESATRTISASAIGGLFTNQLAAWQMSPSVYEARVYNEMIKQAVAPTRKYVLTTTNSGAWYWLNLEDKIRDLSDIKIKPAK